MQKLSELFSLEEMAENEQGCRILYFLCTDIEQGKQVYTKLTGYRAENILADNMLTANWLYGFTIAVEMGETESEYTATISPTIEDEGGFSDIDHTSFRLSPEDLRELVYQEGGHSE